MAEPARSHRAGTTAERRARLEETIRLVDKIVLTTEEAAVLARVGLNTLYSAINSGQLVARKPVPGRTVILRSDLDIWPAHLPKIEASSIALKAPRRRICLSRLQKHG